MKNNQLNTQQGYYTDWFEFLLTDYRSSREKSWQEANLMTENSFVVNTLLIGYIYVTLCYITQVTL